MNPIRRRQIVVAATVAPLLWSASAQAEDWPAKAVNVIVPYVAGGGVDPVARLVSQKLALKWKQPVVVENRAGASGTIGAAAVARAEGDGTTILMSATAEVVINEHFMARMPYSPSKDLKPVTLLVKLPFALVTKPGVPFADMAGLVAYARQNPGKLSYASSGPGTPQHLAGVLLENTAGIQLNHVPYKGVAAAMTDIIGGQVDMGFAGLPTAIQYVKSGKVRALGVSSSTPSEAAPTIAPLASVPGLAKFELMQWFGVFVPAKTPDAIVARIQHDIADVLSAPDVRKTLLEQGATPSGMPTAEFVKFVASEREKFRQIVKSTKIEQ